MTRDELQRRIDALCAERGEPAGTVVVSFREDGCGWGVAFTSSPDETEMHPLDIVARGESEQIAYDSAWAQASRYMEERVERAIARTKACSDELKACSDELKRAEIAEATARRMRDVARGFNA